MSFDELLALLKEQGHTGAITVHLLHGTPKRIDVPAEPQRILLDTKPSVSRKLDSVV